MAYLIGLFFLLASTAANADPISFITAFIIEGLGLTGWAAFAVSLAGSVFGMARQRRQQKKLAARARDEYNKSLEDRSQTVLESNPPARIAYGVSTFAGSPVAIFTSGNKDQYKHVVLEWAHHECEDVLDYLIDGVSIGPLDANGYVTEGKYYTETLIPSRQEITTDANGDAALGGNVWAATLISAIGVGTEGELIKYGGYIDDGYYRGGPASTALTISYTVGSPPAKIRINTYLGDQNQAADSYLMSVAPDKWTSSHRMRGRCYSVVTLDLNEQEFQGGFPQLTAKVKGKKVYDPRTGLTVWSDNAALCIADYLTSPLGKNADYATIIEDDLIAAANICDELITPVGGTAYAKYTINGTFTTQDEPLESMALAMAGVVSCPGGWSIMAGAYSSPVLSLGDRDFVGEFEISNGASRADLFNGVTGQYFPIENPTVQSDFRPYVNSTYVTQDGEELLTDLNYPFTNTATRVEQLNRIAVEDHRQALTIRCGTTLKAWELKIGQRVSVTNTLFGYSSKVFRVMEWSLGVKSPVQLTLKEDAVGIWDAADDVQYDQAPNNILPSPYEIDAVEILSVESGTDHLRANGDGTISSRIYLTYTASDNVLVTNGGWMDLEVNRPDVDDVYRAVQSPAGDSASAYIDNVEDAKVYNIRARWNNRLKAGEWVYTAHLVIGQSEPPPPFDVFIVLAQADGTRQFNFGYTTTTKPVDWQGAEIRYIPGEYTVVNWDSMYRLNDDDTYYTASPVESNQVLSGMHTFACRSRDRAGNLSTVMIDSIELPSRRQGNVVVEYNDVFDGTKTDCHLVSTGGFYVPGTETWETYSTWTDWATWGAPAEFVPGTEVGYLEADDTATWSGLGDWDSFTRWIVTPASPISYTSLVKDIGLVITSLLNIDVDADGTVTIEARYSETSDDPVASPSEWSSWGAADVSITARYIQYRVSVAATMSYPISVIRSISVQVTAPIESDYINDQDISTYTGSYRIGTGDIRVMLPRTYGSILRVNVVIQDSSAGQWTWQLLDKTVAVGPRVQFKLDGTLDDPALVDFFIEGFTT
jgi:hypothetical protein